MAEFETFTKSLVPLGARPRVTVQKRGTITLNTAAHAALGSPEAVELLYDRRARVLGLRAVAVSAEQAAFVRPSTRSGRGPYVISAMAFLKYYEIDSTVARRWPAVLDGDVLCIDLAGPCTEVSKVPRESSLNTPALGDGDSRARRPDLSGGALRQPATPR